MIEYRNEMTCDDFLEQNERQKGERITAFPDSYVVLDIETTGFDPCHDSIIEISAIKVKNNNVIDTYSSLVSIDCDLPAHISGLTGITNDMLSNAPDIDTVIFDFTKFTGNSIIVGHNVSFDLNFITEKSHDCLERWFYNDYVDTLCLARTCLPELSCHKLGALCEYFGITQKCAHRALDDCMATLQLFNKLESLYSETQKEYLSFEIPAENILREKFIYTYGTMTLLGDNFASICKKSGIERQEYINKDTYCVVLGKYVYKKYIRNDLSESLKSIIHYSQYYGAEIISEQKFCEIIGLSIPNHLKYDFDERVVFDDIVKEEQFLQNNPLFGEKIVITGTLSKYSRERAHELISRLGGICQSSVTKSTKYLILGCTSGDPRIKGGKSGKQKKAEELIAGGCNIILLTEQEFYDIIQEFKL